MAPFTDDRYPPDPYPGARPPYSYVHLDGVGHPVEFTDVGWRLAQPPRDPLDAWLADRGADALDTRTPLLTYGSNACPAKITWLRAVLGLQGPVVVIRARCTGLAAVWAAGRRVVDDQRPATLAALPGTELHAVWFADARQLDVLDICEGRGARYDLARIHTGRVELESGEVLHQPLAYVGASEARMPLLVDGVPVRCSDAPQSVAGAFTGTPAMTDGLDRTVLRPTRITPTRRLERVTSQQHREPPR